MNRTVALVVAGLALSLISACGTSDQPAQPTAVSPAPAPASSTSTLAPEPAAPTTFTRYFLSGRVTDEAGAPIADTFVEVDYPKGGDSNPASRCVDNGCWFLVYTKSDGSYEAEFEPGRSVDGSVGYAYTFGRGRETMVQILPTGSTTIVQDLRVRPVRRISAGESTSFTVESDASRCTDLEDNWLMTHRCEIVTIDAGAGTLVIEARAADGGDAPRIFGATSGKYAGPSTRPAAGTVAMPIRGGTYKLFFAIPDGHAPRRFDVVTSMR